MGNLLNQINSPEDLKNLPADQLNALCEEIRQTIIETVSMNGGHLASNLGVVELTVAIHRVFNAPEDKIVWDVGHQSYTHKILTGRGGRIETIRTKDGLSGFPNPRESDYDAFESGHSSTSISAALGLASAKKLKNEPGHVIAVIGDGALTGGLAYEGLNNAGRFNKNLIVILNDNKMSISRNVGSMSRYLAHIRATSGYLKMKGSVEHTLDKVPGIGLPIIGLLSRSKSALKRLLYRSTLFEDMGFAYYGPFDGHDTAKLTEVLENTKDIEKPVLLHVITSKGKGYSFAEKNPGAFHGISSFDIETGEQLPSGENFSEIFGRSLCEMAEREPKLVAITAAMDAGTGLNTFRKSFPNRFFDVGIAEEHAVTFSAGLAAGGLIPVFAVYSTFLQRAYDQIIHDAALQNLHVTLAIDRAGLVGEDGETHQGLFDVAFLNSIPNVTVFAPSSYPELTAMLQQAVFETQGVCAVRYPRGKQLFVPHDYQYAGKAYNLYGNSEAKTTLVTYGRLFSFTCLARQELSEKLPIRIVKLNRIKPVDQEAVALCADSQRVLFFEEGIRQGGLGEHFGYLLEQAGFRGEYHLKAVDGRFIRHESMQQALAELELDAKGILSTIKRLCTID